MDKTGAARAFVEPRSTTCIAPMREGFPSTMKILRVRLILCVLVALLCAVPASANGAAEDPRVECPEVIAAFSLGTGDIRLAWSEVEGAEEYRVYRAIEGSDDFALVETATFRAADDDTTEMGTTYEYRVTAVVDGVESSGCGTATVTAVPFFGSAMLGAAALLGTVGAFVFLRRR